MQIAPIYEWALEQRSGLLAELPGGLGRKMPAFWIWQLIHLACRGPQSIQHLPWTLRNNMAQLLSGKGLALRRRGEPLGVCVMTADFWGLRSAGGTATAYHLLAQVTLQPLVSTFTWRRSQILTILSYSSLI